MKTDQILAWHNDPAIKAEAVARMHAHRAADEIIQGTYALMDEETAAGYRGCFHGCLTGDKLMSLHGWTPSQLEDQTPSGTEMWHTGEELWGILAELGRILDNLFEGLPAEECAAFAVDAVEAIPVGADLSRVLDAWLVDLLADPEHGVARLFATGSAEATAAALVIDLFRAKLAGDTPSTTDWEGATDAVADVALRSRADLFALDAVLAASKVNWSRLFRAEHAGRVATFAAEAAGTCSWQAQRLLHHIAASAPAEVTA